MNCENVVGSTQQVCILIGQGFKNRKINTIVIFVLGESVPYKKWKNLFKCKFFSLCKIFQFEKNFISKAKP